MASVKSYGADDIEVLEGLEAVRKRPAMYIGSTNLSGLHHLVWEIVDNGVDEALNGYGDTIAVTLHKDGSISVEDRGRGIPCGIQSKYKVPAIHLIFSTLHAGGKFSSKVYSNAGGLHGVGAAVTNALSEWLDVTVMRDGKIYHIRYEKGGKLTEPLKVIGDAGRKTGTLVRFKPDPKIFSSVDFKWETITRHLQESAFLLKKVRFIVKDERVTPYLNETYLYNEGLKEYVSALNVNKTPIGPIVSFEDFSNDIKMEVAFQYCANDYNENIYSYANNVRTHDGGTHETGFKLGITRAVNDFAEEKDLLRGKKLEGGDIREGLTAILSLKVPESLIQYEGQTKSKLGTPEATALVNNFIYTKLTYFLNENNEYAVNLINKCIESQNARIAARKAKDEARGKKQRKEIILSDKLTPAQSKDYKKNELFIVEGESAGGSARKGRDRLHQAILPLRGKPLNTDSITMDRMLKNEEFATIINTIGAGVGSEFDVNDSRYGKIIIMTDADTDGAHIQTLLLTFFYHYMRPLITNGMVYVAVPPLYRVFKEGKEQYAWRDNDLEEAKAKIGRGYEISRFKGLGEMDASQLWETTMNPEHRMLVRIRIDDPLLVETRVAVLMGKDASLRRKWVEENVDFNEKDNFEELK
ncbi:MAG: type IIA DNA topoisomerase subunit B [Bacilli bacterium]|nr:type IIA DNA topoisomerase subunit B [Bacilli bacterium]